MMTPEQYNLLVDRFDENKDPLGFSGPDQHEPGFQQEWHILQHAVDAIRWHALRDNVQRVRSRFEAAQDNQSIGNRSIFDDQQAIETVLRHGDHFVATTSKSGAEWVSVHHQPVTHSTVTAVIASPVADTPPAIIRRWISPASKIAAVFIVAIALAAVIKLSNTSPETIFASYYRGYELGVTRGADASTALERAYRDKDWAAVLSTFRATRTRTQKDYFLAAMAYMEHKDYYEAISLLKALMLQNATGEPWFQDEAEYYLAMNYLATGQSASALSLINKIKADPRHVFHHRIMQMSLIDLSILEVK
jgi:tetratricopeptide (TPR) repeat protein